jgi:[FeFe] hydrogenase H-cluster maturation GTPase HydF
MKATPRGLRLHIGLFGRRNVGKSSLLNALAHQEVAIVSPTPGTTTDPVEKAFELQPLGPVLFVDTAGIDDEGALGELRVAKTRAVVDRTDLAILVTDGWQRYESELVALFAERKVPVVIAANKSDLGAVTLPAGLREAFPVSATTGAGLSALRQALIRAAPDEFVNPPAIVGDLVPPGQLAVLVVPIDKEAPKGRLILPQVQTIRDLLDNDAACLVVKERELAPLLARLKAPPALVVTDSQAFLKVAADTPPAVPMTSFSILFARYKGDLAALVRGALAIEQLRPGHRVLIGEACSHHPIADDIGRVKIPRWLEQYVGGKLQFDTFAGHDFPAELGQYQMIVHCGACVANRREMLTRIEKAHACGVPITNYGLCIAYSLGIFERALQPFPYVHDLYRGHAPQ